MYVENPDKMADSELFCYEEISQENITPPSFEDSEEGGQVREFPPLSAFDLRNGTSGLFGGGVGDRYILSVGARRVRGLRPEHSGQRENGERDVQGDGGPSTVGDFQQEISRYEGPSGRFRAASELRQIR